MKKTKIIKNLLWIIRTIYRYEKKYIFLSFCNAIFNGITPVISLLVMQKIVNLIQISNTSLMNIFIFITIYILIELIKILSSNIYGVYNTKITLGFTLFFSKRILRKVSKLKLKDYENSETYDIINRAKNQGGDKLLSYYNNAIGVISNIVTMILYLSIVYFFRKWIIFVISFLPVVRYLISNYFNSKSFNIIRKRTNDSRKTWYYEYILTYGDFFKELKTYDLFDFIINRYANLKLRFNTEDTKLTKNSTIAFGIISFIECIIDGILFAYIILLGYHGDILIGDSITYTRTILQSKTTITNIVVNISELYKESLFIDQIFELLSLEEEINEGKQHINHIDTIELINVSYKYRENSDYTIKNINLKLESTQKVAIMGRNGSGKTTLIKLIMGFYDDYEGKILINGLDLKTLDKKSYLINISSLFQDYIKYEASLRENIAFGNLEVMNQDNRIYEIIENFGLQNIAERNIDVHLGSWFDNGINLSAGQWQRIALARTSIKKCSVYILDEPDAALDIISEEEVINLYDNIFNGKIGIIITHKFSKLLNLVDYIITIDDGTICEKGTHSELIKQQGIYGEMFKAKINNMAKETK